MPARFGGLDLVNPVHDADGQFQFSRSVSGPLVDRLMIQNCEYSDEVYDAQLKQKKTNLSSKNEALREKVNRLCESPLSTIELDPFLATPETGGARARREKGLHVAQVTFNWSSTNQSDSTTKIWSFINN